MIMNRRDDNRIYVGNLPPDIREIDIEDLFFNCGRISYIDLKNKKGPPFAFVAFEDHKYAACAVKYRDGFEYDGYTLRVEFPKSAPPGDASSRVRGRGSGMLRGVEHTTSTNRIGPPSRRSDFRVLVSGLPCTGSWQDLKDHMREAGDVCYADVYKEGTGVVEFMHKEDMKWAVKNLDNSKFRSHENELSRISVTDDYRGGRESRSPPHRGRESPSYSPIRHSRSRSRSL